MKLQQTNNDYIVSYMAMRQLIGVIGIALPFALIIGNRLLGNEHWLQISISHYFYSYMHIAFVGVLCILGGVLISYREKEYRFANSVATFAGYFAILVAAFPTAYKGFQGNHYFDTTVWHAWFKYIHFGSAALLFVCFAIFCFVIFQKSDEGFVPSHFPEKKKLRNRIYKLCGWGIVISILMIAGCTLYEHITKEQTTFTKYATFIFETTALLCFGNSWLLKGSVNWKHSDSMLLRKMASPVR
jgi:membrane-bound metal-dependent hydrolase YbcI (DUF457 family)